MPGPGADEGGADDLVRQLARWAAGERAASAASALSRSRSLAAAAAGEATWIGTVVDLAEAAAEVTVTLRGGGRHRGRVVGAARDFAVVERHAGGSLLVPYRAMTVIAPAPGGEPERRRGTGAAGRQPALELSLAAALDELAAERTPVALHTTGDAGAGAPAGVGTLVGAGVDVLTLEESGRRLLFVALESIVAVELR
jgi:hypothetical protein